MKLKKLKKNKLVIILTLILCSCTPLVFAQQRVDISKRYKIKDVRFSNCTVCTDCNQHKVIIGKYIELSKQKFIHSIIDGKYSIQSENVNNPIYVKYSNKQLSKWPEYLKELYNKDLGDLYIVYDDLDFTEFNISAIFYDLEGSNPIEYASSCLYDMEN